MNKTHTWRSIVFSDLGVLILLALLRFIPLLFTAAQTGWHRDELDMLDNARYLAWGYVAYPPLAPFIARIALTLFGASIPGVRFFPTLAQAICIVLVGLMARELGGKRWAMVAGALAVFICPIALLAGDIFSYSSFDYLWWVVIAYLMIRLLKSGDPRWWLGIGAAIGLGMLTKYTMIFLVTGIALGVILTPARRFLKSPWLWGGAALAFVIFLPTLIWQYQHNFIALEFTRSIHARDVRIGRSEGFILEQFIFSANLVTIPLWIAGLYYYLFSKDGKSYRTLGWMYIVPFVLFYLTQGRSYYLGAAYPMLFASGAVMTEKWLERLPSRGMKASQGIILGAFVLSGLTFATVALPLAPVNSTWWNTASDLNGELREKIGWPELVETVAGIYSGLPAEEKAQAGILTANYGEAGAINLFGPAYGLPTAISGINSYWERGFGNAPQTVILLGFDIGSAGSLFKSCERAGTVTNRYGVKNEESGDHPAIYLCREPRGPWPEKWKTFRWFG